MSPEIFLWIFIALVLFEYFFSTILDYVNDKNWKDEIPEILKDFYDNKNYTKARDYKIERGKISFVSTTISVLITLCFLWFEGFGILSNYIADDYSSPFIQTAIFFLVLFIFNTIISLPFSYYSTFYIEEKFGFNKTTLKIFIMDKIKGILLSMLIGGVLLWAAMYLLSVFNEDFWIWLWIGLSAFMVFINMFYAELIVPIFNKLTPLKDGSLREKIEKYSKKVGYSLKNIYVIDGSKRSTKANAFFSGLGPKKTIALYDTLIEKHGEEELVAVLAHEVGHYKRKHIFSSMIFTIIELGIMCFLFEMCMNQTIIAEALGSNQMYFHLGLIGFSFLYSPVGLITGIMSNMRSRKNEFEADDYARSTYDGFSLELALKKLSVDSLSNLYPHPLFVFVHYSHPPLLQRLEALGK
jgi:STE24 endopeptidase